MAEALLFNIDNQKLAFDIDQVERVIWAEEVTPVSKAPRSLLGTISIQGRTIPVIHLRQLLGLPKRKIKLTDQMVICQIKGKTAALLVDSVQGLYTYLEEQTVPGSKIYPDLAFLDFVIQDENEKILAYKWEELIPMDEIADSVVARA